LPLSSSLNWDVTAANNPKKNMQPKEIPAKDIMYKVISSITLQLKITRREAENNITTLKIRVKINEAINKR
jgi:hypothetical protein